MQELEPALSVNIGSEKLMLYQLSLFLLCYFNVSKLILLSDGSSFCVFPR